MSRTTRNNPDQISYLLHGIDRQLWEAAQAKAASYTPKLSMKLVIVQFLEKWVGPDKLPARRRKPLLTTPPSPKPRGPNGHRTKSYIDRSKLTPAPALEVEPPPAPAPIDEPFF